MFIKLVDLRKKSIKNNDLLIWEQAPFHQGIPPTNFDVQFIMERIINQETESLEKEGILLGEIPLQIKIIPLMIVGKMTKLCDGAGGCLPIMHCN